MGLFEHFPYTNFHELNLDWILSQTKKLAEDSSELLASFEDLKNYVMNLDLQSEVDTKIDEMAEAGYFDHLADKSFSIKGENVQICRKGRLLDNFNYTGGSRVLGGQSVCFDGQIYYSSGELPNGNGTVTAWSGTGQLLNSKTDYDNIGHGNSIAVLDDVLYIADGGGAALYKVDKTDLSYIGSIDMSEIYSNCYSVSVDDDKIYTLGRGAADTSLNIICKVSQQGHITPVCSFTVKNSVRQGFTVKGDFAYVLFNRSNQIYKIRLSDGAVIFSYKLPKGDGYNPLGEPEDLFKIGDVVCIAAALYYPSKLLSSVDSALMAQIFETDIDHVLQQAQLASYMQPFYRIRLSVSENNELVFNPENNFTTIEEACFIATYLGGAQIVISGVSHGYARLTDGIYSVTGTSGSRTISALDCENARILTSQIGAANAYLYKTAADLKAFTAGELLRADFSSVKLDYAVLEDCEAVTAARSSFTFNDVASIAGTMAITISEATSTNVSVFTPYVDSVSLLGQLTGETTVFIDILLAGGRKLSAAVAAASVGSDFEVSIYNDDTYSALKCDSGSLFLIVEADSSYIALTSADYVSITA